MFFPDDPDDYPFNAEDFLLDAVDEILLHEDHALFMRWAQEHIHQYYNDEAMAATMPANHLRGMAILLGGKIWDATPLPGNNFKTRPVPLPKRNTPCLCGSGRKFKQCCRSFIADVPEMGFDLETELIWSIIAEKLSPEALSDAIGQNRIPLFALTVMAGNYLEEGRPKKALALLEPFFSGDIRHTGYDADAALAILLDIYDDLRYQKKKQHLIASLTSMTKRSPLRSAAFQRLATMRMDAGDHEGAWAAFQQARRDAPDDPAIGGLEVNLLLSEQKVDQVRQRADFWRRKLKRQGVPEEDVAYQFFVAASEDPVGLMSDIEMDIGDGEGVVLRRWLGKVRDRPVPHYELTGCGHGQAVRYTSEDTCLSDGTVQLHLPFMEPGREDDPALMMGQPSPAEVECILKPPGEIEALEKKWHQVFPLQKPFSINLEPFGSESPWNPMVEDEWIDFLSRHPEAFDSLDILDDLATAVQVSLSPDSFWTFNSLMEPVLERARSIIGQAVGQVFHPIQLPWEIGANRPGLRSLVRLYYQYAETGKEEAAHRLAEWLLALNPVDNHGLRSPLINTLLRKGKDSDALTLAARFPQDMLVETVLGRILALYRLNRLQEAESALAECMEVHKLTIRNLWRKRVKKPPLDEYGITVGGEDQAWLYRDTMRDVWDAEPGALDWLRKTSKKYQQPR